jgi:hypothetical protein
LKLCGAAKRPWLVYQEYADRKSGYSQDSQLHRE